MVCLAEHVVKLVESKMLGEQLVGEAVHSGQAVQFHYSCYVASLKPGNMSMAMRIRILQRESFLKNLDLEMLRSRDFCSELLILWHINRFKSIERPRS